MSKNETLFLLIGLAIGFVVFFFQTVCQDETTGNLTAVPWWYPCPTGGSTIKSAGTD